MLAAFEETGCDIVSGWRQKRVDNFFAAPRAIWSRSARGSIRPEAIEIGDHRLAGMLRSGIHHYYYLDKR